MRIVGRQASQTPSRLVAPASMRGRSKLWPPTGLPSPLWAPRLEAARLWTARAPAARAPAPVQMTQCRMERMALTSGGQSPPEQSPPEQSLPERPPREQPPRGQSLPEQPPRGQSSPERPPRGQSSQERPPRGQSHRCPLLRVSPSRRPPPLRALPLRVPFLPRPPARLLHRSSLRQARRPPPSWGQSHQRQPPRVRPVPGRPHALLAPFRPAHARARPARRARPLPRALRPPFAARGS